MVAIDAELPAPDDDGAIRNGIGIATEAATAIVEGRGEVIEVGSA